MKITYSYDKKLKYRFYYPKHASPKLCTFSARL